MSEQKNQTIQLLKDAGNALALYEDSKSNYAQLTNESKQLSKDLNTELRAMENDLNAQLKRARAEIDDRYMPELKRLESNIRKIRAHKEKARSKGVKKRIREESAPIEKEIDLLREASRSELKNAGISPAFNTPAIYQLIAPKGLDFILLAVIFAIVGICIPGIIYLLIPERKILYFAVLCMIFIALIVLFYIILYKLTKGKNKGAMLHARKNYDLICINRKKIRALSKAIENDEDDERYNLTDLNASLDKAQTEYDQKKAEYDQEVEIFENERKPVIEAENRNLFANRLDILHNLINEKTAQCSNAKQLLEAAEANLDDNYTVHIGKRYMKPETLEKLASIIADNQAETIEDAIEVLKVQK